MAQSEIIVLGANGQLGRALQSLNVQQPSSAIRFLARSDFDLEEVARFEDFFSRIEDCCVIINCAAYTDVERAEENVELSKKVNFQAAAELARLCALGNKLLLQISTDFVFAGDQHSPRHEEDPCRPLNVYGRHKYQGEQAILASGASAIILRTSWLYSSYAKNFVTTIHRLSQERSEIQVVEDEIGSPTWAHDLAQTIRLLVERGLKNPPMDAQIYHYANAGQTSRFEFAQNIVALNGSNCIVRPVKSSSFTTLAHRPAYSVLGTEKIRQAYGIEIPPWRDSLRLCMDEALC